MVRRRIEESKYRPTKESNDFLMLIGFVGGLAVMFLLLSSRTTSSDIVQGKNIYLGSATYTCKLINTGGPIDRRHFKVNK